MSVWLKPNRTLKFLSSGTHLTINAKDNATSKVDSWKLKFNNPVNNAIMSVWLKPNRTLKFLSSGTHLTINAKDNATSKVDSWKLKSI